MGIYTKIKQQINQNYKNIILFLRNHLFCLIYVNNKLKITTTKNIVMSFIPFSEKYQEIFLNFFDFWSDPESNPGQEPDPYSRKRIRGSGSGSETLIQSFESQNKKIAQSIEIIPIPY